MVLFSLLDCDNYVNHLYHSHYTLPSGRFYSYRVTVGRNCLSSRMEITVEAKDIERGGKILSNNSYSRKVRGIKMCLTWCMLSKESFLHIVDCAQLYEKKK